LSQIITLVENAQSSRAPIQNLADVIASKFVPIVIGISFLVFIAWFSAFESGLVDLSSMAMLNEHSKDNRHSSLYYSFLFGISVLVISCPCALGLATPTAVMVATGKAAEFGILFKGGEPLEVAGKTKICIFDKTGTLTQGRMQIVKVCKVSDKVLSEAVFAPHKKYKKDIEARWAFWNFVFGAEQQSEHLIASAVCNFITGANMEENNENLRQSQLGKGFVCQHWKPDSFEPMSGYGVTAVYKECALRIGNFEYMKKNEIAFDELAKSLQNEDEYASNEDAVLCKVRQLEASGNTVIFIAVNGELCAIFAIADQIKADARRVIDYLQQREEILCYMITGDNEVTANAIGKAVGIPSERIRANVSPQNKQRIVKQLQNTQSCFADSSASAQTQIVTFVGDGINDSPSLAQADVGIAIGAGTDVAIASASVVLMNSKLMDVLNTIDVSKATVRRIRMNFGWALVYNLCMIPFAAGAFYPIIHYALPPFMAGLLMCLSSISVVCNSLLLKLYKPPKPNKYSSKSSLVKLKQNGYHSHDSCDRDFNLLSMDDSNSL